MFSVTYGKQTFDNATDSVSIFALPLFHGSKWRDKSVIGAAFKKSGRSHSSLAARDGFADHGKWYQASFDINNSVRDTNALCIQLTQRRRSTIRTQCTLHVLPHDQGPMLTVKAVLGPNDNSVNGDDVCVFAGNGFLLDHAELKRLGVDIERGDIAHYMDAGELED